jgi:hypothetical protein
MNILLDILAISVPVLAIIIGASFVGLCLYILISKTQSKEKRNDR